MYISYIDDSGSTGSNYDDPNAPFQVIGGPMIEAEHYVDVENRFGYECGYAGLVPEDRWESFEFKACDLFSCSGVFEVLGKDRCHEILEIGLSLIPPVGNLPGSQIICGIVDKRELNRTPFASADAYDVAFHLYLEALANWIHKPQTPATKILLIADNAPKGRPEQMTKTFRKHRRRINLRTGSKYALLFDDLYFGDSKYCLGIQLADLCVYFINRHLQGQHDSERFYRIIRDQIAEIKSWPETVKL